MMKVLYMVVEAVLTLRAMEQTIKQGTLADPVWTHLIQFY